MLPTYVVIDRTTMEPELWRGNFDSVRSAKLSIRNNTYSESRKKELAVATVINVTLDKKIHLLDENNKWTEADI